MHFKDPGVQTLSVSKASENPYKNPCFLKNRIWDSEFIDFFLFTYKV